MNNNNNLIQQIADFKEKVQQLDECWIDMAGTLYDLDADQRFNESLNAYCDFRNNLTAYMLTLPNLGKEK